MPSVENWEWWDLWWYQLSPHIQCPTLTNKLTHLWLTNTQSYMSCPYTQNNKSYARCEDSSSCFFKENISNSSHAIRYQSQQVANQKNMLGKVPYDSCVEISTYISPSFSDTTSCSGVMNTAWEQSMVMATLPAGLRRGKLVEMSDTELSDMPTVGELWLR